MRQRIKEVLSDPLANRSERGSAVERASPEKGASWLELHSTPTTSDPHRWAWKTQAPLLPAVHETTNPLFPGVEIVIPLRAGWHS